MAIEVKFSAAQSDVVSYAVRLLADNYGARYEGVVEKLASAERVINAGAGDCRVLLVGYDDLETLEESVSDVQDGYEYAYRTSEQCGSEECYYNSGSGGGCKHVRRERDIARAAVARIRAAQVKGCSDG